MSKNNLYGMLLSLGICFVIMMLIFPGMAGVIMFSIMFAPGIVGYFFYEEYKTKQEGKWKEKWSSAKYTHFCRPSAIALDIEKRVAHLRGSFQGKDVDRSYPFADIRKWRYSIQTGGTVYSGPVIGSGLSSVGASLGSAISDSIRNNKINEDNAKNTGFFIEVRDIDFPEWQIYFPAGKTRELEMKRWMEIFNQNVNQEQPSNLLTRLSELAALREKGVLTEEEFAALKAKELS
ncbi:MAG: DUF4755 domain-containing protein [Alphaproteobacteria bacterium]|nr:DUF4755 domain-containing protein [Alphaproteobacteria bacterium]